MDGLILLAAVFATYRLATDVAHERGPYDLYSRLRGRVIARYGADDWRSEGVSCPICLSFWIGLVVVLLVLPFSTCDIWLWPLWWLGVSGAAAALARRD